MAWHNTVNSTIKNKLGVKQKYNVEVFKITIAQTLSSVAECYWL